MFSANIKRVAIFCAIWILFTFDNATAENICSSSSDGLISWPDANCEQCVRSNPFCLSENMEILSRCCNSGGKWTDAPNCSSYQNPITNPCPDHFDWKSDICVFVLESSVYPPECPYEENLPFSQYISVVDPQFFPIWMPVQRIIGDYGLDLMRWVEPSSAYKSAYKSCSGEACHDYYYEEPISSKNCLIYHNSSLVEAVSCNETHTAICAYQSLPNKLRSFCSQNFPQTNSCIQSNYSTRSKCFCQGQLKDTTQLPKAEFHESFQNLLYSSLNGMCYIGLEKTNGSYFWKNCNTTIEYSNWAEAVVFDEDNKYGAITTNGWVMLNVENETDCVLYETDTPKTSSIIVLDYIDDYFVVKLSNRNSWLVDGNSSMPMVFCFTDASSSALITKVEITRSETSGDEAWFYFQRHPDGPGNYWCDAFLYPDLVAKRSNKYLLRYTDSFSEEYVVILSKSYAKGTNPLSETSIYEYQKLLADQIQTMTEISHFHARIFKIVSVNEEKSQITINFHIANPNKSKSLTYYITLLDYMENTLIDFTFVRILDVDYCVGLQAHSVTWPVAPVNTVTRPREGFCIGSNGFIVNRECYGNYIDGADWLDLDEPCTIQQSANATVNLTNIIALNSSAEYMEQIVEITKDNLDLSPQDVDLISRFFEQITYSNYINLTAVSTITNQLMGVPRRVLQQSQAYSNSTDRILYQLHNIIHHSGYIGELSGENFHIITDYTQDCNLTGVIIRDNGIQKVCNESDLNTILKTYEPQAALLLSKSLISRLLQEDMLNSKIVITIYEDSKFFNEIDQWTRNSDVVFGVTFPSMQEVTEEILTVYRVSEEEDVSCSYWGYDVDKKAGYWAKVPKTISNSSVICSYDYSNYFTLLRNDINVTRELEDIIDSEDLVSEKLEDVFLLLNGYHKSFQPIDVELISELLDIAAQSNEDNLDLVVDIIDVVVDIPKEILEKSQRAYNATRKIVYYFDQILQNVSSSRILIRDNVYAIVQVLMEEELLYGFTLVHSNGIYGINLLDRQTSFKEVLLIEDLDTALLISKEMLDQLLAYQKYNYVPKITAAVFFKDSLFLENDCSPRIKTKIVGINFPNFDDGQEGDIALLYNLNSLEPLDYSCSVYPSDTNDSTTVKETWTIYSPSEFVNGLQTCVFWTSTYFSLTDNLGNLTENLGSMLNSTEDMEAILKNTSVITKNYYECLQPIDIILVANLLSKVEEINDDILNRCLTIVNDVMRVPSKVLRKSQEVYNATNMILDTFTNIAASYNQTKEIYKDNMILIISLLSETGMHGIRLENCSVMCDAIILNETTDLNTALNKSNVELTLSSNLVNNLLKAKSDEYDPKLVLIIFYTNALFVEEDRSKDTSQIFGVYFPGFDKHLPGVTRMALEPATINDSNHYDCVSWNFQTDADILEGIWTYESRPRNETILTCNFFEHNFFTILNESTIENITHALESILSSDRSALARLFRAQDISYYYMDFLPYDILQFSNIIEQCNNLGDDGLDMISVIVNNILRTPQEVLLESVEKFDALRKILQSINHISSFEDTRKYSVLNDQFGLVVCQLNSNSANGIILTEHDIKCTYEVSDDTFTYSENIVASLILSKEIVAQINTVEEEPKIVVTVFSNNVFFNMEEISEETLILGLSVPNLQGALEGDVVVLYNNSIYDKTKYGCSFWENFDIWRIKGAENLYSFIKCRYSEATYFTLMENSNTNSTVSVTLLLEEIINSNKTPSQKLVLTSEVVEVYLEQFEAYDVYLISIILSLVDSVDATSLEIVANIISNITNLPRNILAASQEDHKSTDWILYYIDRIAKHIEEPVKIETDNFAIISKDNISGIYVENCNGSCRIGILFDVNFANLYQNVNTALVFDDVLRKEIQSRSSARVVVTVYFNNALFNDENGVSYKNVGPIIGIILPSQDENLNGSLLFYYYTKTNSVKACAFWHYVVQEDALTRGYWQINRPLIQPSQVAMCEGKHTTHFTLLQIQQNVTSDLENIINSNSSATEKLEELSSILTDPAVQLRPVDIYLIAKILEYALEEVSYNKMNLTSVIVSSLFQVPRRILRESQLAYYATDKILHTVEEMAKTIGSLPDLDIDPVIQDNFTVAIYDLKETNVSGLLLENCSKTQCDISVLENSVNLTEFVGNKNVQTAIVLSDELLEQIRQDEGSPKLAVSIYFSDVLFNEQSERKGKVSMVCGILLPGFKGSFLGNIYVLYNTANTAVYSNNSCAFWNFKVSDGEEIVEGSWKLEVDPRNKDHFAICEYDHITHFALLLARDNSIFADANKYKILDIITAVFSVLSIIGIFSILLTAALFERWRRNTGNQILVHFSIAMSIKMIMLYVSAGVYEDNVREIMCYVTGGILHYAILSEFCWMLIIGILQFKRFVEVLGGPPKFVLLKACICGWVFPMLPVLLILLIDKKNYSEGNVGLCYPSGLGLYLGIWLPIIIIVSINFVIFIFIIYNVFHKKTESRDIVNHEILFQWRLALLLFSMLGLTWLFGFMSQIPGAEEIFVYLFCISATMQGFIMFLFFIVFNKSTRFLYSQSIKMWLYSKGYKMH